MKSETKITTDLVRQLRESYHAKVLNLHGHAMQERGWPDLYIVHWAFVGFIECKGQRTELRKLQIATMKDIILRGGTAYVLRFAHEKTWYVTTHDEKLELAIIRFKTYKEATGILLETLKDLQCGTTTH